MICATEQARFSLGDALLVVVFASNVNPASCSSAKPLEFKPFAVLLLGMEYLSSTMMIIAIFDEQVKGVQRKRSILSPDESNGCEEVIARLSHAFGTYEQTKTSKDRKP